MLGFGSWPERVQAMRELATLGASAASIVTLRAINRQHQPRAKTGGDSISHLLLLLCYRSLGSGLEVVDERGHVVLVSVSSSAAFATETTALINQVLQEAVLLRADLLEDVWEHILHLLRFVRSHDREQVLAHRELHCTRKKARLAITAFAHELNF